MVCCCFAFVVIKEYIQDNHKNSDEVNTRGRKNVSFTSATKFETHIYSAREFLVFLPLIFVDVTT